MSIGRIIVFGMYSIVAALTFLFGVIYLTRKQFMPYHAQAVETPWEKVDSKFQVLLIALLKVAGGGMLSNSLAIVCLLFLAFMPGAGWANPALFVTSLSEGLANLWATSIVKFKSKANPPWLLSLIIVCLSVAGFILGFIFPK